MLISNNENRDKSPMMKCHLFSLIRFYCFLISQDIHFSSHFSLMLSFLPYFSHIVILSLFGNSTVYKMYAFLVCMCSHTFPFSYTHTVLHTFPRTQEGT